MKEGPISWPLGRLPRSFHTILLILVAKSGNYADQKDIMDEGNASSSSSALVCLSWVFPFF